MNETYIKVKGEWKYLYRAVDKQGRTIDFLLTDKRDAQAARRLLKKAIEANGVPRKINIDKSGWNKSAIAMVSLKNNLDIELRQCKYLNNIIEQDDRVIKCITKPTLRFKSFQGAKSTISGIELIGMIRKTNSI